ncbi:MAG: LON peptidase substrate-binding domain-containing protein, partial [bacterium]|nr:LON peptidase substrate-binding domain-containing protein [Candidatus Methylomirabilis sp.]
MLFGKKEEKGPGGAEDVLELPLLPLRDIIVFPYMVVPLFVGRERSIRALEAAIGADKRILLCAQKQAKIQDPGPDDIHPIGTVGAVIQLLRLPDSTAKVLIEGKQRARVREYLPNEDYFLVRADKAEMTVERDKRADALMRSVIETFERYVKLNKRIPPEMVMSVGSIEEPGRLADTIVAHLSLKLENKQAILEALSPLERLEKLFEYM